MRVLLYEYKKSIRKLRKAYREAELIKDSALRESEKKIINSMISDLEYVVQWIEHGREPRRRRGVDKTMVYLKPIDVMDSSSKYYPLEYQSSTFENNSDIEEALSLLTDRQREIFILHYVELLSANEIADLLNVKRGTILGSLKRSRLIIERMNLK